jgi:hypothetical protein
MSMGGCYEICDSQQRGTVHRKIGDELLKDSGDFGRRPSRPVEMQTSVYRKAVGVIISSIFVMGWMCKERNPAQVGRDSGRECVV